MKYFPHYTQLDAMDCGATCLRMVAKYYGREFSNQLLRERSFITRFRTPHVRNPILSV